MKTTRTDSTEQVLTYVRDLIARGELGEKQRITGGLQHGVSGNTEQKHEEGPQEGAAFACSKVDEAAQGKAFARAHSG